MTLYNNILNPFHFNSINIGLNSPIEQYNTKMLSAEEVRAILENMKKVSTEHFFKADAFVINQLKNIDATELKKILDCFFLEIIQEEKIEDPIQLLDKLAEMIPLEKLQEAVKENVEEALIEAKSMLEEAKLYFQKTSTNNPSNIQSNLSSAFDGIISIIETFIDTFGIGNLFGPSESDMHIDSKSKKILTLFSFFSLFSSLIPSLGPTISGLIVGGILLSISALGIIWRYIKPITTILPANAENWTKQIQTGKLIAQGRKEEVDEIANIIKMDRHALLIGSSRVGKNFTAKAFAQAIERGDYPELKGKTVFCINTAEIIGQKATFLGNGNKILNLISEKMGRHRNDIILVFDEIHIGCKNKQKIADQLKTFLDDGGEFPHVIGITTEEDYEKDIKKNQSFAGRFDKVYIKSMEREETLKVLCDVILKKSDKPLIKENTLDYLYDSSCKDTDFSQPAASLKLLKKCFNKTKNNQILTVEQKMIEISNKIFSLYSLSAAFGSRKKEITLQIADLEKQKNELQKMQNIEKKEGDKLFKTKNLLDLVKKETYLTSLKIATIKNNNLNLKNEKQLKLFLLLHKFLGKSLESYIEETARILGIKLYINKELIDEVLQESYLN